ncbi:MAG: 50S ribosomal protein L6, partial [Proteobacteria bacterium]|nr:50S ribosomal protein L6 [Pseudomonadota bacterium]
MSRIGKNPVEVPDGVEVQIDGQNVRAKGKLGELSATLTDDVEVGREDNVIWIKPRNESLKARKLW